MEKRTVKILKSLLFLGIFAWGCYGNIRDGSVEFITVMDDLFSASIVYLCVSLLGLLVSLLHNYILAIVATAGIAVFLGYKFDDLVASVEWLDFDKGAMLLAAVVTIWVIKDIIIFATKPKRRFQKPIDESYDELNEFSQVSEPVIEKTAQQVYKENPEWMMNLSKQLERERGHKPTYEELIDYVDKELFRVKSSEEVRAEVHAEVEKIRKQVREEMEAERAKRHK